MEKPSPEEQHGQVLARALLDERPLGAEIGKVAAHIGIAAIRVEAARGEFALQDQVRPDHPDMARDARVLLVLVHLWSEGGNVSVGVRVGLIEMAPGVEVAHLQRMRRR